MVVLDKLFGVICRVGKYSDIKTPLDAVAALYHYSMLICLEKFIVE